MNLENHPRAKRWLNQFAHPDLPLAGLLLRSLKLVSHEEFESGLSDLLLSINNNSKKRVALVPIRKPVDTKVKKKDRRIRFSSAERVGHFLVNLEKGYSKRFLVSPTIKSMRAEKTDLIILVDDIIGSGKRLLDYWKKGLDPSIKSWLSYKKCALLVITYAAHPGGIKRIRKQINYFRGDHGLMHCLELPKRVRAWDQQVESLCKYYGKRTSKPGAALGYGDSMSPVVFQHGCPNNAPVILWCGGHSWEALFPNRSIPIELYEYFGEGKGVDVPEILWRSGQCRLSLQVLEAVEKGNLDDFQIRLLTILGLLLRGVRKKSLKYLMMLTVEETNDILSTARNFDLIDNDYGVTAFGKDLVERFRRIRLSRDKVVPGDEMAQRFYYPQQYRGVQRKSSAGSIA